jgi:hypothetical protein
MEGAFGGSTIVLVRIGAKGTIRATPKVLSLASRSTSIKVPGTILL